MMNTDRIFSIHSPIIMSWEGGIKQPFTTNISPFEYADWKRQIQKDSQLPRVRSASTVTCATAILLRTFITSSQLEPADVGLIVASTSAAIDVAYQFELMGKQDGWDLVDPFALPNTIPSASATQPALSIGTQAFAFTVLDHFGGGILALELATLMLHNKRASAVLVVCAEEFPNIQADSARICGFEQEWDVGASAISLTLRQPKKGEAKLAFIARGYEGLAPIDWSKKILVQSHRTKNLPPNSLSLFSECQKALENKERFILSTSTTKDEYMGIGIDWA